MCELNYTGPLEVIICASAVRLPVRSRDSSAQLERLIGPNDVFGITSRALLVAIGGWIAVHLAGAGLSYLAVVGASGLFAYSVILAIAFRAGVWKTQTSAAVTKPSCTFKT